MAASVLVAILPKCPVCLAAHATVLGALGVVGPGAAAWVRPGVIVALAAALALLGFRARRRRGYGPLALGAAAAALIVAAAFHPHAGGAMAQHGMSADDPHASVAAWAGAALLMAASLWNAFPARTAVSADCGRHAC